MRKSRKARRDPEYVKYIWTQRGLGLAAFAVSLLGSYFAEEYTCALMGLMFALAPWMPTSEEDYLRWKEDYCE